MHHTSKFIADEKSLTKKPWSIPRLSAAALTTAEVAEIKRDPGRVEALRVKLRNEGRI